MTVWNLDHKHRIPPPSLAEQIENGLALGGLTFCLIVALLGIALALGLL